MRTHATGGVWTVVPGVGGEVDLVAAQSGQTGGSASVADRSTWGGRPTSTVPVGDDGAGGDEGTLAEDAAVAQQTGRTAPDDQDVGLLGQTPGRSGTVHADGRHPRRRLRQRMDAAGAAPFDDHLRAWR